MVYSVAIFDIDGTLSNPGDALTECARYALAEMGITETSEANLRRFVGPPLEHSFKEYYGFSDEQAREATSYYRQKMRQDGVKLTVAYDGIEELLQTLQATGVRLAVATSKVDYIANEALRVTDLAGYFEYVAAERPGETVKKEVTLRRALQALAIEDMTGVVMIGDRRHDVEAAKAAGIGSIGVLWGYGTKEELAAEGATHIVSQASDITNFFA